MEVIAVAPCDRDDSRRLHMNEDQMKGKANQAKGEVKDRAGGALGDNSTQAEGKMDKVGGKIQEGYGNLKEKLSGDKSEADHKRDHDLDRNK
jgi:uncharacterized protein YjbJ (UPF0337 family)